MKKYMVKTTCTFGRFYLEAGSVVEFDDDVTVPSHLVPLSEAEPKEEEKEDNGQIALSQAGKADTKKKVPGAGPRAKKQDLPGGGSEKGDDPMDSVKPEKKKAQKKKDK